MVSTNPRKLGITRCGFEAGGKKDRPARGTVPGDRGRRKVSGSVVESYHVPVIQVMAPGSEMLQRRMLPRILLSVPGYWFMWKVIGDHELLLA